MRDQGVTYNSEKVHCTAKKNHDFLEHRKPLLLYRLYLWNTPHPVVVYKVALSMQIYFDEMQTPSSSQPALLSAMWYRMQCYGGAQVINN